MAEPDLDGDDGDGEEDEEAEDVEDRELVEGGGVREEEVGE